MSKIVKTFKFPNDSTEYQVNAVELNGKTADELMTTVDSVISDTSTNPVQNKVIAAEFELVNTAMNTLESVVDKIEVQVLNIDYSDLEFDTTEIVVGNVSTTSVLGQAILGQMVLA